MSSKNEIESAWQAVDAATDPQDQRQRIERFLALNQAAGAPPMQVLVKDRETGARAPIDKVLWENPHRFELTLRFGDREYRFIPQSRVSLEPLFRE